MIIMLKYTDNNNRDNIFFQQAVSKDYFPCFVQIIIIIHQVFFTMHHCYNAQICLRNYITRTENAFKRTQKLQIIVWGRLIKSRKLKVCDVSGFQHSNYLTLVRFKIVVESYYERIAMVEECQFILRQIWKINDLHWNS